MTKSLKNDYPYNVISYPSFGAEIEAKNHKFMVHQMGIDTIEQIAKYETVKSMVQKLDLEITPLAIEDEAYEKYQEQREKDSKKRLLDKEFPLVIERIQLPKVKGRDKGFYITIVRNTPTLFDVATHHKKAKDTYCLIVFAGLHQPSKRISSEAMKIISKFLKRKAFKLHRVDIAIDTTDKQSINYKRKEAFRANLMPYSKHGVICKGSSLYVNRIEHSSMSRIIYYDKYKKQLKQQGKEIITNDLKRWKRLEVTFTYDVTKSYNRGFISYIESLNFIDDLFEVDAVAKLAKVKNYDNDFLLYQLNSLIDNRFMNNHESKEQFNSVKALERFKSSDFRRYVLPI